MRLIARFPICDTLCVGRASRQTRAALWLGVALTLVFFATRLNNIASYPFFLDEGLHVRFTEETLQHHPFFWASKYYVFSIWWWALFGIPYAAPIWITRVVTLIAVLPGFAAALGLGRLAAGVWGLIFAGLVYLFSTYHFFFDRLGLADPISASAVMVAVYFGYRLSRRAHPGDAILTGFAAFLAAGAKLSALPYLGIPVAAVVALRPRGATRRERLRWLVLALATEIGLLALFLLALIVTNRNPFSNAAQHFGTDVSGVGGLLNRTLEGAQTIFGNLNEFLGAAGIVVALLLLALVWFRRFYFLLCLAAPALVFFASSLQTSRYYAAPMSLLVLCVALGLGDIARRFGRAGQVAGLGLIAVWALVIWLPFVQIASSDPYAIPLPRNDFNEYARGDGSGYGIREMAKVLREQPAETVIGLLANCVGLRYETLGEVRVECPTINPNGSDIPDLEAMMTERRAEPGVYVVLEAVNFLPASAPGDIVATVEDASGRPRLTLYRLSS